MHRTMTIRCVLKDMGFRLMSVKVRLRDRLHPPSEVLRETGVRSGMAVLDFGCSPGGFIMLFRRGGRQTLQFKKTEARIVKA